MRWDCRSAGAPSRTRVDALNPTTSHPTQYLVLSLDIHQIVTLYFSEGTASKLNVSEIFGSVIMFTTNVLN